MRVAFAMSNQYYVGTWFAFLHTNCSGLNDCDIQFSVNIDVRPLANAKCLVNQGAVTSNHGREQAVHLQPLDILP
jgi:hypothetical protein